MHYLSNLTTNIYIYKLGTNVLKWRKRKWNPNCAVDGSQRGPRIQSWTSAIMLLLGFIETESQRQMELVSFQSGGTE